MSGKQSGNADILVELVPMNTDAAAAEFEFLSLGRSGSEEAREIGERRCQSAAILEKNPQAVRVAPYFGGSCFNR